MEERTSSKGGHQMESNFPAQEMTHMAGTAFDNIRRVDVFAPECPGHRIMDVIAKKWTVLIIYALAQGPKRYFELERKILGVTPKMLASVLRMLEANRLVKRTVYPTIPPNVDYALTELGWSLVPPLAALCQWADDHLDDLNGTATGHAAVSNAAK